MTVVIVVMAMVVRLLVPRAEIDDLRLCALSHSAAAAGRAWYRTWRAAGTALRMLSSTRLRAPIGSGGRGQLPEHRVAANIG